VVQHNGRATVYFAQQHLVLTPEGADALQPVQRADGGLELWTEYLLNAPESAYQVR